MDAIGKSKDGYEIPIMTATTTAKNVNKSPSQILTKNLIQDMSSPSLQRKKTKNFHKDFIDISHKFKGWRKELAQNLAEDYTKKIKSFLV